MSRSSGTTEFHLSVTHAVIMVGLTLGCLFAAFLIGYRSGRGAGYQDASLHTVGNAPRFGIPSDELPQKVPDELVSKVYAKLQENIGPKDKEIASPKLEKIPEVNAKPKRRTAKTEISKTLGDLVPKKEKREKKKSLETQVAKKVSEKEAAPKEVVKKEIVKKEIVAVAKIEKPKVEQPKDTVTPAKTQPNTLGGLFELGNAPKKISPELVPPKLAEIPKIKPEVKLPETKVANTAPQPRIEQSAVEKPAIVTRTIVTNLRSGWYVQVAAPNDQAEAKALIAKLRGNGFLDSSIQAATVKGKQYYRVLVGPEDTAVLAQRLLSQVSREPYIKTKPYLKRISG